MSDFENAFLLTVALEGGDSNDPDDRGGLTRYGISQKAYPHLDIKALTLEDAKAIYKRDYWDACGCDRIDSQAQAEIVFDMAVNMGVGTARSILLDDRIIDPGIAKITLQRIARYVRICQKNPSQKKFLIGWISRALNVAGVK